MFKEKRKKKYVDISTLFNGVSQDFSFPSINQEFISIQLFYAKSFFVPLFFPYLILLYVIFIFVQIR